MIDNIVQHPWLLFWGYLGVFSVFMVTQLTGKNFMSKLCVASFMVFTSVSVLQVVNFL